MSSKLHELAGVLQRNDHEPWGIRLVGGNDLDTPLIITRVQVGSPAHGVVLRGDIISKIAEYDARDLSHAEAQHLFRSAGNEIKIVVHRDNKIAYSQELVSPTLPFTSSDLLDTGESAPHRAASPFLPRPGHYERALQLPVNSLPHTKFPKLNESGGYVAADSTRLSPKHTSDHQQDVVEEQASIANQSSKNEFMGD